jgi:hypothetical protein
VQALHASTSTEYAYWASRVKLQGHPAATAALAHEYS